MSRFDLHRFLVDVFDPQPGETVAVLVDEPRSPKDDRPSWAERRAMASAWRDGIEALGGRIGFTTLPLVAYPATMANGADLPERCRVGDREAPLAEVLDATSLVLAMTEYSPTAALVDVCKRRPGADVFRAASMPGVEPRMEGTSLAADYAEVARRCRLLRDAFRRSSGAEVVFSTGHRCFFDLRHRTCETDDGYLHRDKNDDVPVINLPSGETFCVPYEGEKDGDPSRTEGELPVAAPGGIVVFRVERNRIASVEDGGGAAADARTWQSYFDVDLARANVAEVAFGCNERAVVTGNVLEDEKAGFHWAFGRSEHLGGVTGPSDFRRPENVVHQDIVYAKGSPISVAAADLVTPVGERIAVIRDGAYVLW